MNFIIKNQLILMLLIFLSINHKSFSLQDKSTINKNNSQEIVGKNMSISTGSNNAVSPPESEAHPKVTTESLAQTNESIINGIPIIHSKNISAAAILRMFYVVLGLIIIVIFYIAIKTLRLRRHRAENRYRVISRGEDTESFFPLNTDDDEEEIFSSFNQQGYS